jgi:hypothetical protein
MVVGAVRIDAIRSVLSVGSARDVIAFGWGSALMAPKAKAAIRVFEILEVIVDEWKQA